MTALSLLAILVAAAAAALILALGWQMLRTQSIARSAERLVPPAGRFAEIGRDRLHYVEAGAGRPIVFIHGLGAQLHHFTATVFPRLSADFRLVALDRPGSGYSTRPLDADAGIFAQARAVRGLIDALGLERPLVVGHSLGGAVALALAAEAPQAISGLALIAPLTRHREQVPPAFAGLYIPSPLRRWLTAHTVAVPAALKMADAVLAYVFSPQQPAADYMIAGGGWLGLRPSHIYATCSDFVALDRDMPILEQRLGSIDRPVGVLFGTSDNVLSYALDGASLPARLTGAALTTLDGIGHMPQFVAPEDTETFIRKVADLAFAGR